MDITLVTTSFNDEVHGSENERKTGCGINLLRPENVTRYRRSGTMTDLKDITCEKCKAALAKKIIRADKKEMDRLIKEERLRAKKGIVDDGIVPLGNTTAKITRDPAEEARKAVAEREAAEAKAAAEKARREAAEAARREAEEEAARLAAEEAEAQRLANRPNITGTNVPMDDSLAQFAINVPKEEPEPQSVPQDDFLAQFAIQKPAEDETPAPVPADDFLAQFAVNANGQQNVQQAAPVNTPEPVVDIADEDDIMKMFAVNNGQTSAPAAEEQQIIDVGSGDYSSAPSAPEKREPEVDLSTVSEWDMVANQIFGYEYGQQNARQPVSDEMEELPIPGAPVENSYAPETPAVPEIEDIPAPESAAPAIESEVPQFDEIPVPESTAPQFDEISVPESAAPQFDDISVPDISASQFEDISVPDISAPQFDDIAAPEIESVDNNDYEENGEDDMNKYRYSTPVFADEIRKSQPTVPPVQSKAPDQPQIITVPQFAGYDMNGQPIYTYVQMQMAGFDQNGQPIFLPLQGQQGMTAPMGMPQAAPVQQPKPAPVQQAAPVQQPKPAPVQQAAPVQQPKPAPVQQAAPVQQPKPAPVQQAAPVQQPKPAPVQQAAPVQQPKPAPVQQAPVQQPIPVQQQAPVQQAAPVQRKKVPVQNGPYTTPTANISKIAVNPHSKSTSQAFINAIASSKNYADKNLIETQGLQANAPLLNSIEDALSQMGDDSLKKKNAAAAKQNVPVFDEYTGASKPAARPAPRRQQQTEEQDIRFMTKSELKAKKKQDKIDAKFKKDLAKRGF